MGVIIRTDDLHQVSQMRFDAVKEDVMFHERRDDINRSKLPIRFEHPNVFVLGNTVFQNDPVSRKRNRVHMLAEYHEYSIRLLDIPSDLLGCHRTVDQFLEFLETSANICS